MKENKKKGRWRTGRRRRNETDVRRQEEKGEKTDGWEEKARNEREEERDDKTKAEGMKSSGGED